VYDVDAMAKGLKAVAMSSSNVQNRSTDGETWYRLASFALADRLNDIYI